MAEDMDGRAVVVTGAGRGIGRSHALRFAQHGARVVVNDNGVELDGTGGGHGPADEVVAEIRDLGGEAVANYEDVTQADTGRSLVETALEHFGRLDTVVNNAGILRDRMLVNLELEDWDAVIQSHLRSTFIVSRAACAHWREQSKAGNPVDARIVNTSSPSGIYGNVGQSNYGAAKAGVAALTIIAATEVERYGVLVNAIAPGARTRMTENLGMEFPIEDNGFNPWHPDNVAALVTWLGSGRSRGITGRVFNVVGGTISVAEGWVAGPERSKSEEWSLDELDGAINEIVAEARPNSDMNGRPLEKS